MRDVLIIDDDAAVLEMMTCVLEDEGYQVVAASSAWAALEYLRSARRSGTPPALILLDLAMPGMNGAQFISALRAEQEIQAPPIVIITASRPSPPPDDWGIATTLTKPFDIDDLLAIAHRFAGATGSPHGPDG